MNLAWTKDYTFMVIDYYKVLYESYYILHIL